MIVANALAPAVVDDHAVLDRRLVVEPGEQLLALPVLGRHVPLAVGEDDRRLVAGDDVLELGNHVLIHIESRGRRATAGLYHSLKRVVEAHLEPGLAHGVAQLAEQVAMRACVDGVPRTSPMLVWPLRS